MAITPFDLSEEGLLPLGKVPAYLQSLGGRRVHVATIYRWALKGLTADDGTTVRIETVRLGRAHYTSKAAIARFAARLKRPPAEKSGPAPRRRPAQWSGSTSSERWRPRSSRDAQQRASRLLDSYGFHNTEVDQLLGKVGTTAHILGNARNRLYEAGITTREDLAQLDLDEFEHTRGVGKMTREVIAQAQAAARRGEVSE